MKFTQISGNFYGYFNLSRCPKNMCSLVMRSLFYVNDRSPRTGQRDAFKYDIYISLYFVRLLQPTDRQVL
jgi:hypothetical protein